MHRTGKIYDGYRLTIDKALNTFEFIARAYGQPALGASREAWAHDMELVLTHGNLVRMTLSMLTADRQVLYEHQIRFDVTGPVGGRFADPARGTELPVVPAGRIARAEWTWFTGPTGNWRADTAAYAGQFRIGWTPGAASTRADGSSFESEHGPSITGGRTRASIYTDRSARRQGTVISTGSRGYAFVRDDELDDARVFAHARHAAPGLIFRTGQRLSYVLVTVPAGLQARSIQAL